MIRSYIYAAFVRRFGHFEASQGRLIAAIAEARDLEPFDIAVQGLSFCN
jgi:hypothetical protein